LRVIVDAFGYQSKGGGRRKEEEEDDHYILYSSVAETYLLS
jgi:hypothetical protein